jgi:hypothetical protein
MSARADVLVPTYDRPAALAVTLTSLAMQSWREFRPGEPEWERCRTRQIRFLLNE